MNYRTDSCAAPNRDAAIRHQIRDSKLPSPRPLEEDQPPPKRDDLHCECTRTTHQSTFETALDRPIKVDVVEALRRGGRTCHFVAHIT